MEFTYLMTERPPMPGAMPKDGLDTFYILDKERDGAYARLVYKRELTRKECLAYELEPEQKASPISYRGYTIEPDWRDGSWRVYDPAKPYQTIAYTNSADEAKDGLDDMLG